MRRKVVNARETLLAILMCSSMSLCMPGQKESSINGKIEVLHLLSAQGIKSRRLGCKLHVVVMRSICVDDVCGGLCHAGLKTECRWLQLCLKQDFKESNCTAE